MVYLSVQPQLNRHAGEDIKEGFKLRESKGLDMRFGDKGLAMMQRDRYKYDVR